MKFSVNQFLKVGCMVSAILTSSIWVAFFVQLLKNSNGAQTLDYLLQNPNCVTYPLFCIFSIIILLKANSNRGILFFSLFLSLISQNIALQQFFALVPAYNLELITTLSFILTSFAYIKSFQNFPQQISEEDLRNTFSNKVIRTYLSAFLKKQIWMVFPIVVFVLSVLLPGNVWMQSSLLIIVLCTALLFLYVNLKISSASSRNKISWLIWGILTYSFLALLNPILMFSGAEMHQNIATLFKILRALSLFVSVTMCLFFFDTFDTGILIRRTIVDGLIFIVIVFLYNIIEHYFLHWLTHVLHISDVLVSSVLSGFFVLIFSPVHHKFMHFLDGRFKHKEGHQ